MYKISVPLVRYYERHDEILTELEKLGAERVFLCPSRGIGITEEEKKAELLRLSENIAFFESKGYEVGVWISTIGHGGELLGVIEGGDKPPFTNLVGLRGKVNTDSFCPLDPEFVKHECEWIKSLAKAGAKMIMLDDDYRLATRSDNGCLCKYHIKEYEKRLGEYVAPEEVMHKAFTGGKNKYRDAYLDMMGDTLRSFSKALRNAVDEVDENIRMGACSCISVWDGDGIDSVEIAKILAGKTKPFIRLIGAAYWPVFWGRPCNKLGYVIELERMQKKWCEESGIEIFGEGDVYPRPRHFVPSAYLEGMDTALRADGEFDGILKYAIDYSSSPIYETGYTDRAKRNIPLYKEIQKHFSDKKCVGVGVSACMKKLADKVFTDPDKELCGTYDDGFFQSEQMILSDNSIPMTYDTDGVTALFGENARQIKEFPDKALIDIKAALILKERGIDTGVVDAKIPEKRINYEVFPDYNEATVNTDMRGIYDVRVSDSAKVLSSFRYVANDETIPAVFNYENADGKRFTVLCFDAEAAKKNERLSRNYCRQRQLVSAFEWLSGKPLPAVCTGNPDLYLMCKEGESSLAVGMWNFFFDSVLTPEIKLHKKYSRIEFINCDGTLCGDTVKLSGDIGAYSFAGFEVFE